MLLLLLTGREKIKVNIKLTFQAHEGENPSLEEFNEFLTALSNLHVSIHTLGCH